MSEDFATKSADVGNNFHNQHQPTEVAKIGCIQQSLVEYFSDIKDP